MTAFTLDTVQQLKNKLKQQQPTLDEQLSTRLHRAISWLQCAEEASSPDMEFIALWISFNACCAIDQHGDQPLGHHDQFLHFIEQLVTLDHEKRIYMCLWEEYSGHVKALIRNPYVFHDFWVSKRNGDETWEARFDQSSVQALNALSRQRVSELCSIVLDRLFVLRNQLVYGGATYKGRVNRDQVQDGAGLLGTLMPIVIDVMLSTEQESWGDIAYPVINR